MAKLTDKKKLMAKRMSQKGRASLNAANPRKAAVEHNQEDGRSEMEKA